MNFVYFMLLFNCYYQIWQGLFTAVASIDQYERKYVSLFFIGVTLRHDGKCITIFIPRQRYHKHIFENTSI